MRAIISVSDKAQIDVLAKGLADMGVVIYSTGGTQQVLSATGIPVRPVSELTDFQAEAAPGTGTTALFSRPMVPIRPWKSWKATPRCWWNRGRFFAIPGAPETIAAVWEDACN